METKRIVIPFLLIAIKTIPSNAWLEKEPIQLFDFQSSPPSSPESTCRFSNDIRLPPELFEYFACASCYRHVDKRLFLKDLKLLQKGFFLLDSKNASFLVNTTFIPDAVAQTFATERAQSLWAECCTAAVSCCHQFLLPTSNHTNETYCPKTWDGWQCWPDTLAGKVASMACPWHVYFHSEPTECSGQVTKICEANGSWHINEWNNEWSDYTSCGRTKDITAVLQAHVFSMAVSVVFLVPALIIFVSFRQLQVFRIHMHKNLFVSQLLNAIFVIAFERHFMNESLHNNTHSALEANLIECRVIYTVTKYLRLCTYMWMLGEGFYLHKLIAAAFAEQKSLKIFYFIGWGFPIIPTTIWCILRHFYADTGCWTVPYSYFEWILATPMLLAIVINTGFLINIIRIVVLKLKSTHSKEPTQFRRAVKATLVLIPLFGLHFLLVIYHPRNGKCGFLHVYNIVTYCVDGLQGALVSIIFCYFNNEVLFLLKRTYNRQKLVRSVGSQSNSRKINFDSRFSISTNITMVSELSAKKQSR